MKNKILMRSSRKLKFERHKYFHSVRQPLFSLDLKYFIIEIKLRYLKSILSLVRHCSHPTVVTYWKHFLASPQNFLNATIEFSYDDADDDARIRKLLRIHKNTSIHGVQEQTIGWKKWSRLLAWKNVFCNALAINL